MSLVISNATIIDGVADSPITGQSIYVEDGRIKGIGSDDYIKPPMAAQIIDATGKYVIPGLMNANVHLQGITPEIIARHIDNFAPLISEAAQVALRNGVTTVFDTWGPRRYLMAVRDRINRGEIVGSRIFCAGNIVGFDGPFSPDFRANAADIMSSALVNRVNAIWVENVGRHLMWLTPEDVGTEVAAYINKGIDFVKYGSNEHFGGSAGAFLAFSPRAQEAIVAEAHAAGITAQAHCMTVEGLRLALEAGCDLITHCNVTGPVPIPGSTIDLFLSHQTGAVIFPWTEKGLAWIRQNVTDPEWTMWKASDTNARNLIKAGAPLMLATDGQVFPAEMRADPPKSWFGAPEEESLGDLATGHFYWLRAMEEKGCTAMELLRSATRNIAIAYGKEKDLGTVETGKIADMLILDRDPMLAADNYRSIHTVIKDGLVVDRAALPTTPILTKPLPPPAAEEDLYKPFFHSHSMAPMFPFCGCH